MRARLVVVWAGLTAAACGKHDAPHAVPIATTASDAAPQPQLIPVCERYVGELDGLARVVEDDDDFRAYLRDEAALVGAATRAPRDADRAELTARCATGLLDVGRLRQAFAPGTVTGGVVGGIGAGGLGGAANALAGGTTAPTPVAPVGTVPACRRLFDIFDRIERCTDVPADVRDNFQQARKMMQDAWSQLPQDASMRDQMDRACQTAANAYAEILTRYRCP